MQPGCCCTIQNAKALNFTPIQMADRDWVQALISAGNSRSSDWCFSNIYGWNEPDCPRQVTQMDGRLGLKLCYRGEMVHSFPVGQGDLRPAVAGLCADALAEGIPLRMRGLTEQHKAQLEEVCPNQFDYILDENAHDYIYEAEKLATLAGKKLHAKRNHINRFLEQNPNWCFEPITATTLPECVQMNAEWMAQNEERGDFSYEQLVLRRVFTNFEALKLEGGLLRITSGDFDSEGGRVIAYTIGERLNDDTYIVHFEKAFGEIQGAYPLINREFVRRILEQYPEIRYINREDDMGIESLRKAKMSYYPAFLLQKYIAVWKNTE